MATVRARVCCSSINPCARAYIGRKKVVLVEEEGGKRGGERMTES